MAAASHKDGSSFTGGSAAGLLGLLVPLLAVGAFLGLLSQLPKTAAGETITFGVPWVPSLGISAGFFIDGLNLLFALLISGIGFFVAIYAAGYLRGHPLLRRFYLYLLLFMVSMLGLVLAADLITLFVFWELTTIASYLLIGFNHEAKVARRAALQALLLTTLGGLCLLAGLILLGGAAGSFNWVDILANTGHLSQHPLYIPILALLLLGAFSKSAQFPWHFWLPNAMAAPTPVSAYLHSATMVKAGIYLLARVHPLLAPTELWEWTLTLVGSTTGVIAAILALRQTDLKLALAYSTVVALGLLTMFLGSDDSVAIAAAITFVLVHSCYKAGLFMVVGIIDHQTGTRDLRKLGGLGLAMPICWFCAMAAALSMAGFPPFLGFIGKELKYEGALAIATEPVLVVGAAVFTNVLMVAVAATLALKPFLGPRRTQWVHITDGSPALWLGPLVLSALGVAFGLFTPLIAEGLVQPAVATILGRPEVVQFKLWHGINVPLLLSILTLVFGTAVFVAQQPLRAGIARLLQRLPTTSDLLWDAGLSALRRCAAAQTHLLQSGLLRRYLFVIFTAVAIALALALWRNADLMPGLAPPGLNVKEWTALALVAAAAVLTAAARTPLAAICALGALGVGMALLYLFFGAPDLAITQLLVETLFLVLAVAALRQLPVVSSARRRLLRPFDGLLAAAVGAAFTVTTLAVIQTPFRSDVSEYFIAKAVPEAMGRNIVNVILVDFRALDTFGEVVVIFTAAIAAATLVGARSRESGK
ncbi:hydrogen gas-evolving membrane-bound hydrogenase subunit E [Microbulbifer sp. TYP-18]|uniref:hydrogen gas-evolving membrane-bound hydrogenase subunit E n=1 Tax=Microbulbifer sp. TYP-18 TaxID=3230024 RepID=UPI0034C6A2C0